MPDEVAQRVVRLRAAFQSRGGALYVAGESAAFPADLAAHLIAMGIAEATEPSPDDEEESAMPAPPAKRGPGRPPKDKMIHRPPYQKGGRG